MKNQSERHETQSSVVVELKMSGSKKNQATILRDVRGIITEALRARGDKWTFIGYGEFGIEWNVVIPKTPK